MTAPKPAPIRNRQKPRQRAAAFAVSGEPAVRAAAAALGRRGGQATARAAIAAAAGPTPPAPPPTAAQVTRLRFKCPSCGTALPSVEPWAVATQIVRRTCRGCRERWRLIIEPLVVKDGLRIDKATLTFLGRTSGTASTLEVNRGSENE